MNEDLLKFTVHFHQFFVGLTVRLGKKVSNLINGLALYFNVFLI